MTPTELKELGLDKAAEKLQGNLALKAKLMIAYEHYRFVEPHIFERFDGELYNKTMSRDKYGNMTYDKLQFIPLRNYGEIPPADCLLELRTAKNRNCFDTFEVAKIESIEVRPDPIIFGCITGCVDKFYITQWDDDVKIEDILKESEG